MKRIFFDVESLPPEGEETARLNPAIISRLCKSKREQPETEQNVIAPKSEDLRKLALHAEYGRVLAIGIIVESDGTPVRYGVLGFDSERAVFHTDEGRTLRQFWKLLVGFNASRDLIIGHNALDFDLPFIYNRSRINRVRPSVRFSFARYKSAPIYDTMREWAHWNPQQHLSLAHLAEVLRLDISKSENLSGATLYDEFLAGNHQAIADYCLQDVIVTRAAYYRLTQPDIEPPPLP